MRVSTGTSLTASPWGKVRRWLMLVISAKVWLTMLPWRRVATSRLILPGKSERGDPELVAAIEEEIRAQGGRIDFARFMALALQHPARGYYRRARSRAGHGGDFLTSPEVHPAFGAVLARQIGFLVRVLGGAPGTWVEAGAGVGTLSNEVAARLGASVRLVALDSARHSHAGTGPIRPQRLRGEGLPFAAGSLQGIYANELLDALPVHRLVRRGPRFRELYVGLTGSAFRWLEDEPSPSAAEELERALGRGARVPDGGRMEVRPPLSGWI